MRTRKTTPRPDGEKPRRERWTLLLSFLPSFFPSSSFLPFHIPLWRLLYLISWLAHVNFDALCFYTSPFRRLVLNLAACIPASLSGASGLVAVRFQLCSRLPRSWTSHDYAEYVTLRLYFTKPSARLLSALELPIRRQRLRFPKPG